MHMYEDVCVDSSLWLLVMRINHALKLFYALHLHLGLPISALT